MKLRLLAIALFSVGLVSFSGCLVQTDNSVNGDSHLFSQPVVGSSKEFAQVSSILKMNCASCHASDIASYTEAQFVSNDLIVPGNPTQSLLYQKLRGSNVGGGVSENMPLSGPPLSTSDLETIRTWIQDVNLRPAPLPTTSFGQAQLIINNSCVGCHKDMGGFKEADFVTNGYVVPGNAEESKLYYKLMGSNVVGGPTPDMPLSGDPLTTTQLQAVRGWIDQMAPSAFPSPVVFSSSPFGKVQKVIGDSCVLCHKNYANNSEADFVTQKLVVPGNPSQSVLFEKLIGSNVSGSTITPTMPEKGAALTSNQLQDVKAWIEQLSPSVAPSPSPTGMTEDQAVAQINANYIAKVQPLIKQGCIECHSSSATPQGLAGKLPIMHGIELKDIANATKIIDFSKPFPQWSTSGNPLFYVTQIKNVIQNKSMPLEDFEIYHHFDGEDLSSAQDQTILNWATQSIETLNSVNTTPMTAPQFFTNNCLGCHNSGNASGGFAFQGVGGQLTIPSGTTKSGIPFITKLDPENSAVYLVLLADQASRKGLAQMPYGGSAGAQEQQLIYNWINQP